MKTIPLTQNQHAIVDDADFEFLNQWKWNASKQRSSFYATRSERDSATKKQITKFMHHAILPAHKGMIVDHINGDKLDNQRANLRLCTYAENNSNRLKSSSGASKFKGVSASRCKGKPWRAHIGAGGKRHSLGHFATQEEAARAHDQAAIELHGQFARLNFPTTSRQITQNQHTA